MSRFKNKGNKNIYVSEHLSQTAHYFGGHDVPNGISDNQAGQIKSEHGHRCTGLSVQIIQCMENLQMTVGGINDKFKK